MYFVSAASIMLGMILIFFTKIKKLQRGCDINMTIILWLLIIAAFMLAFVGLIKPIIPSVLVLWVGFLIYQFGFIISIYHGCLCIYGIANNINFMCGLLANKYFVNRFGGSKFGEYAAFNWCRYWMFCFTAIWNYYHSFYFGIHS